jgi:hypothetical protein
VVTVADAVAAAAVTVLAAIAAAATITVFTITAVATSDLRSRMLIGRVLPSKLSMPLLASTAIVHERPHQSDMMQEAHKRLKINTETCLSKYCVLLLQSLPGFAGSAAVLV